MRITSLHGWTSSSYKILDFTFNGDEERSWTERSHAYEDIGHFRNFWPYIYPYEYLWDVTVFDKLGVNLLHSHKHFVERLTLHGVNNSTHVGVTPWADHGRIYLISWKTITKIGTNGIKISIDETRRNRFDLCSWNNQPLFPILWSHFIFGDTLIVCS